MFFSALSRPSPAIVPNRVRTKPSFAPPPVYQTIEQLTRKYVDLAGIAQDMMDIMDHHQIRGPTIDHQRLIREWNQQVLIYIQ